MCLADVMGRASISFAPSPVPGSDQPPSSLDDLAQLGGAAIALLALVVALLSFLTSRRALRVSERAEARQGRVLQLQLNDTATLRPTGAAHRLLGCLLVVANPADKPNTVISADLHVTYAGQDGVMTTLKIPHAPPQIAEEFSRPASLSIPARLGANSAQEGWIYFRVEDGLLDRVDIDRYDVVVKDVHGTTEAIQVSIFRDGNA